MRKIRYLLSNINLVNILLAGILIAFAYFTFFPGSSVRVSYKKPVAAKKTAEKKPAEVKKGAQDEKNPFPTDYVVIAEQNVFHPDRKIPEQKDEKQEAALPTPEFVLDGTLITDDLKMAFMEDKKAPVNTPGRPNRQTSLKIGDSLSGFTLMEIDKDKVVMQRGEEKMVVALEDQEKSKTRHYSQPATTAAPPGSQSEFHPPRSTPAQAVPQRAATPQPATPGQKQNARQRFMNIFRSRGR
jgi:hypothetical protein